MKTKKFVSIVLAVIMFATSSLIFANSEPTVPQKTQEYKTTGFSSWSAFKNNCDENFSKITVYPQGDNPIVDSNGRMVLGGSGKKNMIVEFPNYSQTASQKYPSIGIKGTTYLREISNRQAPLFFYSYTAFESFPEVKWAEKYKGKRVNAYNAIKLLCKVSGSSGISIGYHPEVFYYCKDSNETFPSGTVSVGYKELWSDPYIYYKETDKYLGPGSYYLKQDSVVADFYLRYENVYNSKTGKYESKKFLDIEGTYDIYENQVVNSNPQKIETKEFSNSVEIATYNSKYNENKTMGLGCYSNSTGSGREEYFMDLTVEYDLSEYYKPYAEAFDNQYKQKVDQSQKTVAVLEGVREEYSAAAGNLDENVREFVATEEVNDYIDKAIGKCVTDNYTALYNESEKTKPVLQNQLNQFLSEYETYSSNIKKYIDYYLIKERLEDTLYSLRDDFSGVVAEVEISDKTHSSITFKSQQGYEYTVVEKAKIDWVVNNTTMTESEKATAIRREYNWQDDTLVNNLKPETEYYCYWRVKATANVNESSVKVLEITTAPLPGDLNHDSVFDAKDVTYLCEAIVGNQEMEIELSDINKDEKINVGDVIYLKKILLGYQGFEF